MSFLLLPIALLVIYYESKIISLNGSFRSDHVLVHSILPDVYQREGSTTEAPNETSLKQKILLFINIFEWWYLRTVVALKLVPSIFAFFDVSPGGVTLHPGYQGVLG